MNEWMNAYVRDQLFWWMDFFGRRKQKIGFFADKTRIPDQNFCFDSKWFRFVFSWWQANCRWKVSFKKNFIIIFQSGLLWIFLKWINFLLDHNDDSHAGTFFISQFGPFNTREKKTVGYEYLIIMRGDITKGQILISGVKVCVPDDLDSSIMVDFFYFLMGG